MTPPDLKSYSHVFILGAGPFAGELEAYFRRVFGGAQVLKVAEGEPNAISRNDYADYVRNYRETSVTYLGSGKTFIRRRMVREIQGRIGPPVLLSGAIWTDKVGNGSLVADSAVIAPHAVIAENVVVNYGATIGHDTVVGPLCMVGPQAAVGGCCKLEEGVYIGAGALVREEVSIGADSTIGMGAIVTRDVPANSLVKGVNVLSPQPAKRRW